MIAKLALSISTLVHQLRLLEEHNGMTNLLVHKVTSQVMVGT